MLAIAASSVALVAACTALTPLTPVHLELDFAAAMTPVASIALAEAARVWTPYQVSIRRDGHVSNDVVVVRVTIGNHAPTTGPDSRAVGSIQFQNGAPLPEITLFEQRAWELICAVAGATAEHWPTSYRELMVGRVLGRALAHELGHYLLQSRQHSATGLMRATQSIADLMADKGTNLFLTPDDLEALFRGRARKQM